MEENNNRETYNINSIMEIEGISDFFKEQIYGDIYGYIRENHLMSNPDNDFVSSTITLLRNADELTKIYLDRNTSDEEKRQILNNKINQMYEALYALKDIASPSKEIVK